MTECTNSLTMYGPTQDLDRLQQEIQGELELISFEKILPTPEGLIEATKQNVISPRVVEQFGALNVNAWRLSNWGCLKNAYQSRMIEESSAMEMSSEMREHVLHSDVPDSIKDKITQVTGALTMSFKTDESPNNLVGELSKKYPSILIHFGYDSETEDVCGWAALSNGEILAHQQYDNCLKTIRVHVESSSYEEKASLLGFDGDDTSN